MAENPDIACAISDIGGRDAMEDEHVLGVESVRPLRALGAVFDGHGGSVGVRSRPGEGSTFWFELLLAGDAGASDAARREALPSSEARP